ncbi:AraC family transcriptional regulator, partial [Niveispirillum sp. KHB5.9]|uniref:AraC family transcriptional regulator n=1 Tax=Niveispirillum sp. KHB5.9 TaxID=3400269 RepID=UPI003A8BA352
LSVVIHDGEPFELGWKPQGALESQRHVVNAGQFHLFPPDHFIHVDWAGNQRIFGLAFMQSFIERTLAEAFGGRIPDLKPMVAVDNPAIGKLIDCLRQGMEETGPTSLLYLDHIGAMLLLKLYETFGDAGQPTPVIGGLGSSRQRRVVEYIEARLGEELNLSHLATEVGLTRYHFIRAFRVSLGTTPFRYLNKRRIARAQQLLLDPHLSITEIGLTLGFSSHSHFTETFRKITGTTPSQFRKDRL